ncbi:DUF1836 domain-containing protein [Paenibacillus albiflavus]|uniref:DUF1836 domain-containing protein n=1 Tax=Paenibacillus albiflavus TaxID=2545760 RepID=A0A4R4E8Y6_9BACL|nr:DUF1836 domain-containing protein [Paenibacillus albiflavus]TCZ75330.1 DUF1836 domain-containing protein [Paenibacillus albiflavus]
METFYLTRKEMSQLLKSLQGSVHKTPLANLQEFWVKTHQKEIQFGKSLDAFISTSLPPIFEKMMKMGNKDAGFSLNDIVALGSQIEYTQFAITSVQNWVKRDFKDLIGCPQLGKKYSLEQAAILFIIEDLKSSLDFDSIRKLLLLLFHEYDNETNDIISPIELYAAYSSIFEDLDLSKAHVMDNEQPSLGHSEANQDHLMEVLVTQKAERFMNQSEHLQGLHLEKKQAVTNTIITCLLAVQTSYFQSLAKRYLNATLFLKNLN